jgi:chromosome partitioning protein
MTAKVFSITQQKGGVGKTTLTAHLAVLWARRGRRVAALDIDPQGSLTDWYEARTKTLGEDGTPGLTVRPLAAARVATDVDRLARDHDIVLIDCPPHGETEARSAIRRASLVLVPVQPSPLDLWATRPTLDLAAKAERPVLLVLNRASLRTHLAATMITRLGEYRVRVARAVLGNRVLFAECMERGLTAPEIRPRSLAAQEIRKLGTELLRRVSS